MVIVGGASVGVMVGDETGVGVPVGGPRVSVGDFVFVGAVVLVMVLVGVSKISVAAMSDNVGVSVLVGEDVGVLAG